MLTISPGVTHISVRTSHLEVDGLAEPCIEFDFEGSHLLPNILQFLLSFSQIPFNARTGKSQHLLCDSQ